MSKIPDGYAPWSHETSDPFEDQIGPFYVKRLEDGTWATAFYSEAHHCNWDGYLHGGLLMSFADAALFGIAREHLDGSAVTVSFNCDFVAAGQTGHLIEASGEVVKATRSLIFARGTVRCGDTTLMAFSGVLKKVKA